MTSRLRLIISALVALALGCSQYYPATDCADYIPPYSSSLTIVDEPDPPPFFVAFGSAIVTSTDGINWKARETSFANFQDAAYGNDRMVAYGGDEDRCIAISENGAHWTEAFHEDLDNIKGLTYGADKFVAVGYGKMISSEAGRIFLNRFGVTLTSPDGVVWTPNQGDVPKGTAVAYGNGQFIAVSHDGILASPDGLVWTETDFDYPKQLFGAVYADNKFVVTGGRNSIFTSPDAIAWTQSETDLSDEYFVRSVAYGNGTFVAVGDEYDYPTMIATSAIITSAHGNDWSTSHARYSQILNDVAFGNGMFVVLGHYDTLDDNGNRIGGITPVVLTSADGTEWTTTEIDPAIGELNAVAFWPAPPLHGNQ